MKKALIFFISIVMVLSFVACGENANNQKNNNAPVSTPGVEANTTTPPIDSNSAANIIFAHNNVTSDANDVEITGTKATIKNGGTYEISGECSNGQLVVDAVDADIYFSFNGISLHCQDSAPVNIVNANNVYILLTDKSVNTFTDGDTYKLEAGVTEPDAAIFCKGDLNISGNGTLNVASLYNDAIASRDKLVIEGGTIVVNAKNHGIKGKDLLSIIGGNISVFAGSDGIKSTNDIDTTKGYVSISGGRLIIEAQDEAISAVNYVNISGGNINIDTANNAIKTNSFIDISGGSINIETDDKDFVCSEKKISSKADVKVNGKKISSNY